MANLQVILWLTVILFLLKNANCGGKLELQFIKYENPGSRLIDGHCCDNVRLCINHCDTFFKVCMDEINKKASCSLLNFQTAVLGDDNFNFGSSLGKGLSNPYVFSFRQWMEPLKIKIITLDDDGKNALGIGRKSDLISDNEFTISKEPYMDSSSAIQQSVVLRGYRAKLTISYKIYCDANYFKPSCSQSCISTNDTTGHYTCDYSSGKKVCMVNWFGDSCTKFCRPSNDVINGYYSCSDGGMKICMPGWHGKDCVTYCIAHDDASGHYTCDAEGNKICLPSLYGRNCSSHANYTTRQGLNMSSSKTELIKPSSRTENDKHGAKSKTSDKSADTVYGHLSIVTATSGTSSKQRTSYGVNIDSIDATNHVLSSVNKMTATVSHSRDSRTDKHSLARSMKSGESSQNVVQMIPTKVILDAKTTETAAKSFASTSSGSNSIENSSRFFVDNSTRNENDLFDKTARRRALVIIGAVFLLSMVLLLTLAGCRKIYQRKIKRTTKIKDFTRRSRFSGTELMNFLSSTKILNPVNNDARKTDQYYQNNKNSKCK